MRAVDPSTRGTELASRHGAVMPVDVVVNRLRAPRIGDVLTNVFQKVLLHTLTLS
jgi:hypothetical protein